MGVSKQQKQGVVVTCKCGCNRTFRAFPVYRKKSEGGGLRIPDYLRGHHPNCRKSQTGNRAPWNAGLKKSDHPSMERMGFQPGHDHWNYASEQNPDWFSEDFDFAAFSRAFGDKPRSKGSNKAYAKFRVAILERDDYTCTHCGWRWTPDEDPCTIHVHHVVPVKEDRDRIFDPVNVVTLCRDCHWECHRHR